MKDTFSTPGDYADAFNNFITKKINLEGNTNTIYNNFIRLKKSSALSFGKFGSA